MHYASHALPMLSLQMYAEVATMQGSKEQQLVLPLIVLICQVRDAIEILPDAADIKYISQQYDLCQQSFSQVRNVFCYKLLGLQSCLAKLKPRLCFEGCSLLTVSLVV